MGAKTGKWSKIVEKSDYRTKNRKKWKKMGFFLNFREFAGA